MKQNTCPVNDLYNDVAQTVESGRLEIPRCRRLAEEARDLLRDIA
jgi:hypothetical protein